VTRRRVVLSGLAVTAIYLLAVPVTAAVRHGDARPLYDAFTLPSSYQFVDPPSFFASGNVRPKPMTTTIALGPHGSAAAGFATPDGQFVVSMGPGAIGAAAGATTVAVRVTPLAPRTLGSVPGGLRPNGNAYRVEMTYEPTGAPVGRFARAGTLLLEIPELGPSLFVSADGIAWSSLAARTIPPRQLSMSASFAMPGYYLGATTLPELASQPAHTRHSAVLIGIATAVVAVVLFATASFIVRRRRARPTTDSAR
jgi:hypothetical protein